MQIILVILNAICKVKYTILTLISSILTKSLLKNSQISYFFIKASIDIKNLYSKPARYMCNFSIFSLHAGFYEKT